ncbi:hypothetical protein FRC17_003136 [Serendipita sp. 399]|nr:hypothetical protein FRC17_003136 [Serendipita sp. 399]
MPSLTKFGGIVHHVGAPEQDTDTNDEVWLLDNIAFRASPEAEWQAEYVAAFFKENRATREKIVTDIVALARDLEIAPDDLVTKNLIRDRVAPFLREIGPHMVVKVQYDGSDEAFALDKSKENGISSTLAQPLGAMDASPGQLRSVSVTQAEREGPQERSDTINLETGRTCFVQDGGWAVISDIDDTIKISEVRDRTKLLKNTFTREPSPVPGMPEFYRQLHQTISTQVNPAPFVYISASPYNLYPFLRSFVNSAGFPEGMIILKDMAWTEMSSVVASLTTGVHEYKEDRIRKVSGWLPKTTWICVGDSTQSDPEVYAQFYKETAQKNLGGRVARIWIHKVVGVNLSAEKELNDPKRFEKAFEGIDSSIWKVFETPQELYSELEALKPEVHGQIPRLDSVSAEAKTHSSNLFETMWHHLRK